MQSDELMIINFHSVYKAHIRKVKNFTGNQPIIFLAVARATLLTSIFICRSLLLLSHPDPQHNLATLNNSGFSLEHEHFNPPFKITSDPQELVHGLFGQGLTWVLECLVELEKDQIHPRQVLWDINTRSYGRVIPGVLIPKHTNTYDSAIGQIPTLNMVKVKHMSEHSFALKDESFQLANDLLHRWFSIEPSVLSRVPESVNSQWLDVHYRGTDKQLDQFETEPVSRDEFLTLVLDFCEQHEFKGLFICSDEEGFVDEVAEALPALRIASIDQFRSKDSRSLHFDHIPESDEDKLLMASFAMSDAIGLSRCGHILKCSSALSAWAKILRPDCQLHQVAVTKFPWFPLSVVQSYEAHTEAAKQIMRRV